MSGPREQADWVSAGEAIARILAAIPTLPPERLPLSSCLGRVLAEDVRSTVDLPPWDNSAMDGFAVHAEDVRDASPEEPVYLRVVGDVPAGSFHQGSVDRGQAVRIMTGAPVPAGADSVVRVEHTEPDGPDRVRIVDGQDAGRNVRPRGEDVRAGAVLLRPGRLLRAAELGVAASVGRSQLLVHRRPVVAVLTSGDELVELDGFAEVVAGTRIVSTNGITLAAQIAESRAEVRMLGIARDDPEDLRRHLERARGCDALITSAGISVGERDHVREVLRAAGARVEFWRVRMRPGSPFAFGTLAEFGGIPWFGLPGNPVSSMVTFELFARPALLRMGGEAAVHAPAVTAVLEEDVTGPGTIALFLRARLTGDARAGWTARLTGPQGSGLLTSVAEANALLAIPAGTQTIAAGEPVTAIVLGGGPRVEAPGYV